MFNPNFNYTHKIVKPDQEKHPQILWKDLAGIRDKLIHHYFGVNLEIVWTIIDEDLPQLRKEIRQVKEKDK